MKGLSGEEEGREVRVRVRLCFSYLQGNYLRGAIYRGDYLQGGLFTGGTIYRGGDYLWDFTVFIFNTNRTPEEMGQRLLMSFSSQMRTNAR